jgi:2-polyprenyl-6-methoxyphenol hydroxylase-like FAD-dependent oxidoreductase
MENGVQNVMIIGGGIGGLALAAGLRQAGVPVAVYERSQTRTDWVQGYRIHINPNGSRALHNCLPEANWREFLATVSAGDGGFGFATEQMTDLLRLHSDDITRNDHPAERHYGVSRISLRNVLLSGMQDVVHLGKTFERYEVGADGRVTAYFADGTSATADLMVGADGANSRVRAQLLPHARRDDTGVVAIAGKYRLTSSSSSGRGLPAALTTDANLVIPSGRGFMFTAVWHHDRRTVQPDGDLPEGFLLDNTADYTFWAYADAADQFPAGATDLDGATLIQVVLDKTQDWSPALRELVSGSDPETVNALRLKSASPVKPWLTGPVTLIGDAIHNMTPMAGVGANTALRDADLLRRRLIAAHRGEIGLTEAVADYERRMLEYGFAAVKQSLRNTKQVRSPNRVRTAVFRTVLRVVNAVPMFKRRMAAGLGT